MKKSGDRVGRYVVEGPLGAGGMGEVYEARDPRLGRRVALKLLRQDAEPSANQRFLREARAAAAFAHPNAVVVYDAGEEEGQMYIAMELVPGRTLRAYVGDASISVSVGRRLRWMIDVARALGAAHRAGLVHRDIKPDNVVLREDGVIKVLDFGIARLCGPSAGELGEMATLTAEGAIVGTPSYWAPEQLRGEEVDGRVDQFAWAVTAYELLCGKPPWTAADPLALLSRILSTEPPPLRERAPDLPEAAEATIMVALAKRPQDRFATIDEAADALEPFAESTTRDDARPGSASGSRAVQTPPLPPPADEGGYARQTGSSSRPAATPPPRRPSRRILAAGAAFVLGGVAVGLGVHHAASGAAETEAPAQAPAPLRVPALGCEPAIIEGQGSSPELAAAIGGAACARLAVELGVEWLPPGHPGAPPGKPPADRQALRVEARLKEGRAEVTLIAGDRRRAAEGPTPIDAIVAAVAALEPELAPRPMTPAEIAAWGARDEAGARRIQRVWRRMLLDFEPDDQAAARELLASDPDSVWSHYIAKIADLGGAEGQAAASKRIEELSGALPPARAKVIRAARVARGNEELSDQNRRSLREAYAEAPDDPVAVELIAHSLTATNPEEAGSMLDRLYERAPSHTIWATMLALEKSEPDDPARRAQIERLQAAFPESIAWGHVMQDALRAGDVAAARRTVEVGVRLGLQGRSSGTFYAESAHVALELATLRPAAARELATRMLGSPRDLITSFGSSALIASYLTEGRVEEALSLRARELSRMRDKSAGNAFYLAMQDISQRLLLGLPPPPPERLAWMEEDARKVPFPLWQKVILGWVAVARAKADPSKRPLAERLLKDSEAEIARKEIDDPVQRDSFLMERLPMVWHLRGAAAAARRWREAARASFRTRRDAALHAGLALEATGDAAGAEQAYRLAMDPYAIVAYAMPAVIARLRLADLLRAQGRAAEAAPLEAELDRVWAGADPGLRERIRAIK